MTPKSTNFPSYVFSRREEKVKFMGIYFRESFANIWKWLFIMILMILNQLFLLEIEDFFYLMVSVFKS